ncbi:MAG: hypothetical protein JWM83_797 [Candidatus Angelobacter sp.]|nr:hypothetical protein [Candidatus Angelobacter sp.]
MKKYLIPGIVLILVAVGIFIRYEIVAPARAAALDLEAINGLTVGKTTEAELLRRNAFQKMDIQCFQGDCMYHTQRTNRLLSTLHLAPFTFFDTRVAVHDGMVTQVTVFMANRRLPALSLTQKVALPVECTSSPCVKRAVLPTKAIVGIMVLFNNESELRNRMMEAAQPACLSRLRGCSTYDELMPLSKGLNLQADAR